MSRREAILLLVASAIPVPTPCGQVAPRQVSIGCETDGETLWEARGRIDAIREVFHPPHERIGWPRDVDRQAADTDYLRGYWREFDRSRFRRGDYDLL
jgi:hypothetical protein